MAAVTAADSHCRSTPYGNNDYGTIRNRNDNRVIVAATAMDRCSCHCVHRVESISETSAASQRHRSKKPSNPLKILVPSSPTFDRLWDEDERDPAVRAQDRGSQFIPKQLGVAECRV